MYGIRQITISLILLSVCLLAAGRPVRHRQTILYQPDGSKITAIINGDEFRHTVCDLEGHELTQEDGWWCYAAFASDGYMYSSGHRAGLPAPAEILTGSTLRDLLPARRSRRLASMAQALRQDNILRRIATAGKSDASGPVKKHSVIILADFADKEMKFTRDDFVRLITEKGYSAYGAAGCAADYFNDQFLGDFEFSFQISDIVTLSGKCADYFGNEDEEDKNPAGAVAEACRLAAKTADHPVDFSIADDDGDGEVDNVFLFVAGKDEADGGGEDCPWSHMHYLQYTSESGLEINGKIINNYALSTEYRLTGDGRYLFTSIGTFCHEYSHALGLMDLYDTDYAKSGGYGNGLWGITALMDGGNSNNNCNTPPHYNALDYDIVGIGNPEPLKVGTYTLEPISKNRRYLKMKTCTNGEYYLLECRSNEGWDEYIGGKGLLIYHIDRSSSAAGNSDTYGQVFTAAQRWTYNEINCRPDRQCAQLVAATPNLKAFDSSGQFQHNQSFAFWPCGAYNAFTALTDPAFVFWDGTPSPLAITDIKMDGENVTFRVTRLGDVELPSVVFENKIEVFQDAAIIQWEADNEEYDGAACVSWGKSGEDMTELEIKPYEPGKYAVILDGLSSQTAYKASLYFRLAGVSSTKVPVNFTTKRIYSNGYPFIFLNNVSRNSDGTFPKGSMLPLRVYNLQNAESVTWYYGGRTVSPSGNGYFEVNSSGVLKAVISYSNGQDDVIQKQITVK